MTRARFRCQQSASQYVHSCGGSCPAADRDVAALMGPSVGPAPSHRVRLGSFNEGYGPVMLDVISKMAQGELSAHLQSSAKASALETLVSGGRPHPSTVAIATFKLGTILKRDFDVLPRHHDFDIHSRSDLLPTICGIQKVDLALAQNF